MSTVGAGSAAGVTFAATVAGVACWAETAARIVWICSGVRLLMSTVVRLFLFEGTKKPPGPGSGWGLVRCSVRTERGSVLAVLLDPRQPDEGGLTVLSDAGSDVALCEDADRRHGLQEQLVVLPGHLVIQVQVEVPRGAGLDQLRREVEVEHRPVAVVRVRHQRRDQIGLLQGVDPSALRQFPGLLVALEVVDPRQLVARHRVCPLESAQFDHGHHSLLRMVSSSSPGPGSPGLFRWHPLDRGHTTRTRCRPGWPGRA